MRCFYYCDRVLSRLLPSAKTLEIQLSVKPGSLAPETVDLRTLFTAEKLVLSFLLANDRMDIDYMGIYDKPNLSFSDILEAEERHQSIPQPFSPRNAVLHELLQLSPTFTSQAIAALEQEIPQESFEDLVKLYDSLDERYSNNYC